MMCILSKNQTIMWCLYKWGILIMKNNIPVNKNVIINPDSDIIYSSSVGIGADAEEVRLILFNKRLISNGDEIEIINESNTQVVLNKSSAIKLKELLNQHLTD